MTNPDVKKEKINAILTKACDAIRDNDYEAFDASMAEYGDEIKSEILAKVQTTTDMIDSTILAARNVRQLTGEEKEYYKQFIAAARSADPKAAITNISVAFPQTIITEVLEDIRTAHPLLDLIDFKNTTAITKWVVNKQGQQSAVWGQLTTAITEELSGNIDTVDMTLCKLTAFMYISNDILDLGPAWVDTYIRNILSEALAIGLETGIVDGDGKEKPIGMTRDVSDDAAIVGGVYPRKDEIAVTALDPETYGTLLSTLAISPTGKQRTLGTPIMVVNPADYFKIVFPATTILTPNGIYATDVLPYPTRIVQSVAVPANHAVLGIGRLYFMGLGMSKNGRIETSEEYKFLEDLTTYKIKTYGNGFPKDNNAFLYLNIQNLAPTYPTVNNIPLEP